MHRLKIAWVAAAGARARAKIQCRVGGPIPPPPGHNNNGTIIGISTAIGVIVIAAIMGLPDPATVPAGAKLPASAAILSAEWRRPDPDAHRGARPRWRWRWRRRWGRSRRRSVVVAAAAPGWRRRSGRRGGPGGGTPAATRPTALRAGCNPAPAGETRFVPNEVVFDIPATVPAQTLDAIAARHAMTQQETTTIRLTGRTLHVWRIDNGASVDDVIRDVCTNPADRQVAGAQPNYLYELAQPTVSGQAQQEPVNSAQYAPDKLKLVDAHRLASGNKVLVAIIDSEVDRAHPDLAGAITASFNAASAAEPAHSHGTGMAGAIAAHRNMLGTAPARRPAHGARVQRDREQRRRHHLQHSQGARLGRRPGRARRQHELCRAARPAPARCPAEGQQPRHGADRGRRQRRADLAAALSGRRSRRHRGDRDRLARCRVLGRQPRQLHRSGGAGRRRLRAGAERRLSALHRHLDRRRRGERRRRR